MTKLQPWYIAQAAQWYVLPLKIALLTSQCYWETWANVYAPSGKGKCGA